MIRVTCKHIPTTVNKEIHKNKHSQEMMQFENRIATWSSLHEPILIYGSSYWSVFESPWYRVQNGHKSESPITEFGSSERVRNAVTHNHTHREEGESTYTHNTLTHIPIHAVKHTYVYKYTHTYYILIHTHTYPCIYYTHTYVVTLTHAHIHLQTHPYVLMHKCMQSYKERGGKSLRQGGEMVADSRPNGGDGNHRRCQRISLGRIRVCSHSPTAIGGDSQRDEKCHPIIINL